MGLSHGSCQPVSDHMAASRLQCTRTVGWQHPLPCVGLPITTWSGCLVHPLHRLCATCQAVLQRCLSDLHLRPLLCSANSLLQSTSFLPFDQCSDLRSHQVSLKLVQVRARYFLHAMSCSTHWTLAYPLLALCQLVSMHGRPGWSQHRKRWCSRNAEINT